MARTLQRSWPRIGIPELQHVTFPLLLPLMLQVPPEGGLLPVRATTSAGAAVATAAKVRTVAKNFMLKV